MPSPGGHHLNKEFYVLQHLLVAMPAEFDLSTAQHTHSIALKNKRKISKRRFQQWILHNGYTPLATNAHRC